MVQFLSINFFLGFLQFLLGFSIVPVLLCQPVHILYNWGEFVTTLGTFTKLRHASTLFCRRQNLLSLKRL